MSVQVCMGASIKCSFGAAPASLVVLPTNRVLTGTPAANVMDHAPMVNVLPFGTCTSMANPAVAAATALAMGALTPQPCVPVTPAPWIVGKPTVLLGSMPALDNGSRLMCTWGGVIEVVAPGQTGTQLP